MLERTNNTLTANVCKVDFSIFTKPEKNKYSIILTMRYFSQTVKPCFTQKNTFSLRRNSEDNSMKAMYFRNLEMIEI